MALPVDLTAGSGFIADGSVLGFRFIVDVDAKDQLPQLLAVELAARARMLPGLLFPFGSPCFDSCVKLQLVLRQL